MLSRHMRRLGLSTAIAIGIAAAAQAATPPEVVPGVTEVVGQVPSDPSKEEMRGKLEALGFANVREVEHSGDIYTALAEWEGAPVSLTVDGETGAITYTDTGATSAPPKTVPDVTEVVGQVPSDDSAEEMRVRLQDLGFTDVQEVEHSGNIYSTTAQWNGRWLHLQVDGRTGGISYQHDGSPVIFLSSSTEDSQINRVEAEEVRHALERIGYSGVSGIEQQGNIIMAEAYRNGEKVDVSIDGKTGKVSEK